MATHHPDATRTFKAEGDLSAKQYYIVEEGTNAGEVDVCDNAGDIPWGVLQNKPTAGQAATVAFTGTSKVVAGGAINIGDRVGTTNAGKAVAKTANNDYVIGTALTAAGADGGIIEVQLGIGQIGA